MIGAAIGLTVGLVALVGSPGASRLLAPAPAQTAPGARWGWLALAAGLLFLVWAGSSWLRPWVTFLVAGGEVAGTVGWLVGRTITERTALANERQVLRACTMIAGQLDVGEIPAQALCGVAADVPLLATAARIVQIGGDVPDQLAHLARSPGCAGLDALARGWRLCERTGMPLGPVTRRVADDLRAAGDLRDQRRAELASSRSTGRLLAGLPAIGLVMGFFVNAHPLDFLTGSLVGHLCLIGAATLACAGLIWTEQLAKER